MKDLLPCPYCGNADPDITTVQPLAMRIKNSDTVRCTTPGCPIEDVSMTVAAWNRRLIESEEKVPCNTDKQGDIYDHIDFKGMRP